MDTILDSPGKCECFDCMRNAHFHPNYCQILQEMLPDDPIEKCRCMQKLYYFKPFAANSWTKDWRSVTHRDFIFRDDVWSVDFPKSKTDKKFEKYTCARWCDERHNEPLPADAYGARTMPNLFEEPRKAIYSDPRKCASIYTCDYTWNNDYRPKGKFPGWCLRGNPPEYRNEDRT